MNSSADRWSANSAKSSAVRNGTNVSIPRSSSGGSPNDLANNLPRMAGDSNDNFASPRSRHPGGVNAVFCDGSAHFIGDNVDSHVPTSLTDLPGTWQRLGWIADGCNPSGEY
jgi:prepilin-type processing-associated H-X9-DG protein